MHPKLKRLSTPLGAWTLAVIVIVISASAFGQTVPTGALSDVGSSLTHTPFSETEIGRATLLGAHSVKEYSPARPAARYVPAQTSMTKVPPGRSSFAQGLPDLQNRGQSPRMPSSVPTVESDNGLGHIDADLGHFGADEERASSIGHIGNDLDDVSPEPLGVDGEHRQLWTDYCESGGDTCGGTCCGETCQSGCSSGDCPAGCERVWLQGEFLMWWINGATVPALVTGSDPGTPRAEAGVLGFPGTTVLSGDESFGDEIRLGTRLTAGGWIGQRHALEGFWMVLGADSSGDYAATSELGVPIISRPFFNARDGIEDSLLVGFPDVVDGTVRVASDSELQSTGVSLRQVVTETRQGRVDLIGGYRYLRFSDSVVITENLRTLASGLFPQNSTIFLRDMFATENHWHGGEIGAAATMDRGRLSVDVLGKLGLGGIRRRHNIAGFTSVTSSGGGTAAANSGLLAVNSNSGIGSQYDFSLLPELKLNLQYRVTDNFRVGAGYTMLFVTRVLRAGDMVDRNVNPNQVPTRGGGTPYVGPPVPAQQLDDSTLRAHGLSLMGELHF